MTKRRNIKNGKDPAVWLENYGLIYTCNAGWLDLGHLNPNNPRPEIGAHNLWRQIVQEGDPVKDVACDLTSPLVSPMMRMIEELNKPEHCNTDQRFRFPDGTTGYRVRYRQDHARLPFKPGREAEFIVKHGLTTDEKKSVALSIFVEVSEKFESFQRLAEIVTAGLATDSGFSQDDLVSNLVGFYVAVGNVSRTRAIEVCHPVSDKTAFAIWDAQGAVGSNKNKHWTPRYPTATDYVTDTACIDECVHTSRQFPKVFQTIKPARQGLLFRKF